MIASFIFCLVSALAPEMRAADVRAADARPANPVPAKRETYTERYAVLSEHNIFVRDRLRPASNARTAATTQHSSPPPEESFVLAGVVFEDDGFRAYVEDRNAGRIVRLNPGDSLARGRISSIDIDALEYDRNGQLTLVQIGRDFTGQIVSTMSSASTSAPSPASTAPAGPQINPNDPNLTMEQRLKLRRMQEIKK
jgi:hypothetical protein